MSTPANSINEATTGIAGFTGTAFTATAATQYNVLVGGSTTSTLSNVAPSATSGVPVISQGASSNPVFGTAVVAGGGTGAVTLTGVLTGNGTSAITASTVTQYDVLVGGASNAISSVGPGTAGQVLQSAGNAANPAYSTATYPLTTGADTMLVSTSANTVTTTPFIGESSWTPGIAFGGATTGIMYASQVGIYIRIGSLVIATFNITLTSKGSASGGATVTGLPIAVGANGGNIWTSINTASLTLSVGYTYAYVGPDAGASDALLAQGGTAVSSTQLTNTNFANGTVLNGCITYFI